MTRLRPALQVADGLRALPRRLLLPRLFDPGWYGRTYPDAAAARGGVRLHWLRHGRHEGRMPAALEAAGAETRLWAGDSTAAEALEALAAGRDRAEAVWARLALARAALAGMTGAGGGAGDGAGTGADSRPAAVAARLAGIDPLADLLLPFGLPGPLLVLAEIAPTTAPRALALLRAAFGPGPGWRVAQAGRALAAGDPGGFHRHLQPLYARAGLAAPCIAASQGPAFDRLAADAAPGPEGGASAAAVPLVSVLMPARAAAATIDTALRSLSVQSWQRIEILVLVNGSDDGTAGRAADWAARDPRIRVVDTGDDPGAYPARNRGLMLAAGDLVTCQDADDWSHPDRIARQVAALQARPDWQAVLPFWVRMDDGLRPSGLRPDVGLIHPCLPGLMIRRAALARAGFWDRVRAGADTEYLARLARIYGTGAIGHLLPDVPLAFGRLHQGSLTQGAATGLAGPGAAARSAYLAAARAWHAGGGDLCLPARPDRRPFPVPPALDLALDLDRPGASRAGAA